jgi:hypothetical protein
MEESSDDILSIVFGNDMVTLDEWKLYEGVEEIIDNYTYNAYCNSIARATIINNPGIIQLTEDYNADSVLRLMSDKDGYYLENSVTGLRSASRSKAVFNDIEKKIIRGGVL